MSIKALNPFAPFWYTPEGEENQGDDATAFEICGLNGTQHSRFLHYFSSKNPEDQARGTEFALEHGLRGWRNFENAQGKLDFKRANFIFIPAPLQTDLAWQIHLASTLSEAERKN